MNRFHYIFPNHTYRSSVLNLYLWRAHLGLRFLASRGQPPLAQSCCFLLLIESSCMHPVNTACIDLVNTFYHCRLRLLKGPGKVFPDVSESVGELFTFGVGPGAQSRTHHEHLLGWISPSGSLRFAFSCRTDANAR